MRILSSMVLSLAFILAACGGGSGGSVDGNSTAKEDVTPPKIVSAALDETGQNILLTFDEALSPTTAPSATFKVSAGTTTVLVGDVAVSGSSVKLKLSNAIALGQTVLLTYSAPDANTAATNQSIQDLVGNDASSITNYSVTVPAAPVTENPIILIGGVKPTLNAAGEYIATSGAKVTITDTEGRLSTLQISSQNSLGEKASTAQNITTLTANKYEVTFSSVPTGGLTTMTFSSFEPDLVIKLRWK